MRRLALPAATIALLCAVTVPAAAQTAAVDALLEQARYWQGKGRRDLAHQAWRRVLQIDPGNVEARRGLAAAAAPPPSPAAKPAASAKPTANAGAAPVQPARAADRGGDARAAGFRALDAGDLEGAASRFRAALSANPRDADALGGLGLARLRAGRFGEARDLLARASRLGTASRWAEALASAGFYADLAAARAAFDEGKLADAAAQAERLAHSAFADRAPALELLAAIREQQGRYGDAAGLYRRAGAMGGKRDAGLLASADHAQAMAAAQAGDVAGARQSFERAIAGDGGNPWIRHDYARFLDRRGLHAEADAQIAPLARASDPETLYAAALFHNEAGHKLQAAALLARIPEASRTPAMTDLAVSLKADQAIERARALRREGQGAQASASLRQLAATPALSAAVRVQIAGALLELGDRPGAASIAGAVPFEDMRDPGALDPLVRVLAATGQDARAYAVLEHARGLVGESVQAQQDVAKLGGVLAAAQADRLRQAGQLARAFDLLQMQWAQAPGDADILAALARLYQTGGLNRQAQQTFQMVLAEAPDDIGALIGLIDAATAAGDTESAKRARERALRLAPTNHEVYLAAARLEQAQGNDRAALRFLARAEQLYLEQTGMAAGGFPASNPFAVAQGGNPFRAAPQISPNPFALGDARPAPYDPYATAGFDPSGYAATPAAAAPLPPAPYSGQGIPAPAAPSYAAAPAAAPGDPVLAGIQRDMQALAGENATRVEAETQYRQRSGETGLSRLRQVSGAATASTGLARGRISAKAEAVAIDAGRPTGSGLARFGRNPTPEAQGIVAQAPSQLAPAETQHASGVALSAAYDDRMVHADVGTTPLGFERTRVVGGVRVTPRLSPHSTLALHAERRAVSDSVVSYAGTRDPVSGALWGAVTKSGGGLSWSYDKDGAGFYAEASWHHLDGVNVPDNAQVEANAGGYLPALRGDHGTLTLGINANYQDYRNNQNFFAYGHGGYFSPQSFLSISFPARYQRERESLALDVSLAPGYQSYDQQGEPVYPTDPAAQAELDLLHAQNGDVRYRFDSISKTGFGLFGKGSLYYRLVSGIKVGGEVNYNSFGEYNEFRAMAGIRHSLGDKQ